MRLGRVRRGLIIALLSSIIVPAHAATLGCQPFAPPAALARFRSALDTLTRGGQDKPVAILHLGDSHIALDHMTGVLRDRWHRDFGDAGRGLPPGIPYRYYAPHGYSVTMSGDWAIASSLRADAKGPFGISGFRISSSNEHAQMVLQSQSALASVEIDVAGAPDSGALLLQLDGAAALRLPTRMSPPGLVRLRVPAAAAHRVALTPAGDGPVSLLGWAMLTGKPGIRYDSYGISGATIDVTTRWSDNIVDEQILALAPSLVILGYGTNEGFNDALDLKAYAARLDALITRIARLAPNASIAVLGPFDGARQARPGDEKSCGDGWTTPSKLDQLRGVQRDVARRKGAWFYDGSHLMSDFCGMDQWVRAVPPLAWLDHVHLRPEGARQAGAALWAALMEPQSCPR